MVRRASYFFGLSARYAKFMVKDSPTRMPSTKSETAKPEISMCTNRPIRMPRAIDIMPIDSIVSVLIPITPSPFNKLPVDVRR